MIRIPSYRRPRVKKTDGTWGWECGCLVTTASRWPDQPSAFRDAHRHAGYHAWIGFRAGAR